MSRREFRVMDLGKPVATCPTLKAAKAYANANFHYASIDTYKDGKLVASLHYTVHRKKTPSP